MNRPADLQLTGIHHVSNITADARGNLDFYTRALGMRLVKKTVNQDDTSVYHLFYADAEGTPGTDVTFFDIPQAGANHPGSGEVNEIALRVSGTDALAWWQERFDRFGISHGQIETRDGRSLLRFTDPEGQRLALLDDADASIPGGTPWARATVPQQYGIRGLGSIRLATAVPEATLHVLTELLGFRVVDDRAAGSNGQRRSIRLESGQGGPNGTVYVEVTPEAPRARLGRGGVHHVAFRVPTFEAHEAWQRYLSDAGMAVTPVIDRFYFRSIYFREPGGVLYELATDEPGFATDEPLETLGESLALPPFLEGQRAQIEARLTPLDSSPAITTTEYVPHQPSVAP
ncbi:MAG: ring-cleaving dioxygenase [Chloroflexota bacterium]|nr:ring-cleaving dioxygenase [Chloroflexota bacterium]